MASKYVPPQLRNKKDTAKVAPIVEEVRSIDESFPVLGNMSTIRVAGQQTGKSFASMASEWAVDAERQKKDDDLKKHYRETLDERYNHPAISLPRFHNVRHFVEPEDDEEEETKPTSTNNDEGGWIEVRRKNKTRRPKTFEEKLAEDELNQAEPKNEDTVWNAEDDETYWK